MNIKILLKHSIQFQVTLYRIPEPTHSEFSTQFQSWATLDFTHNLRKNLQVPRNGPSQFFMILPVHFQGGLEEYQNL